MIAVPLAPKPAAPLRRRVEQIMGMPISLALRGEGVHDDSADHAWSRVVWSLREVDEVFSTYRADSWISRLGRGEVELADCPAEVGEVLQLAEGARQASGGAFDVVHPGPDGQLVLDPSGVVKGWALERAAGHLRELADTDWCLAAGGDLLCHVTSSTSPAWRIGIEDPHDPSRVCAVVPVRRGAVATSGTAHRGAHVIDPRTGTAPSALASVTVIADSLTEADIEATTALVLGRDAPTWLAARRRTGLLVWADARAETYPSSTGSRSSAPTAEPVLLPRSSQGGGSVQPG